ncbi:MAG TPA: PLDc N-terminal domain-containing protein [Burkholderiales bacterium]
MLEIGGLFGVILLALDVWAIVMIAQSGKATGWKVFWIVLILILPVLGLIAWLIFGRRD